MTAPTTGRRAEECKRCKRPFGDKACPDCGRPFDKEPDPHRIKELRAQVADRDKIIARLTAFDPTGGLDKNARAFIHRLIDTMIALEDAGDARHGNPLSAQIRYKRADSTADEGASTRWARDLHRKITRNIRQLLDEADAKMAGTWKPPVREQVRCLNDRCKYYGKRMDRYVGPKGSPIELTHCQKCGNRLSGG